MPKTWVEALLSGSSFVPIQTKINITVEPNVGGTFKRSLGSFVCSPLFFNVDFLPIECAVCSVHRAPSFSAAVVVKPTTSPLTVFFPGTYFFSIRIKNEKGYLAFFHSGSKL